MGGAVFSPEKLGPAIPAPEDFDAFWQAKLKELSDVPPNPVLEKLGIEGMKNAEGMECYRVTLDNIRGTHARGILAKPAAEGKYPAMLLVNSAGVSALDKAQIIGYAKSGWIVLNVSAHDLPVDESADYYKELKEGSLKNYYYIGGEDRETSYFLRMFLGCVRGAEYLASRPEWDGRTLLVTGISQGGLQSFATAALYPKITAVMVDVPAGCDNFGPLANPPRAFGWPYWLTKVGAPAGRDLEKATKTAGYFDGIYFAARIRCPTLVGVALLDIAARPAGVIAAYNVINAPKELIIMPTADHHGSGGTQAAYFNTFGKWREALKKGQPLPIKPPGA
jgi:cephalosporin-C deacetylase-like acetyl esterase